jgi:hypothetical protein
MLHEEEITELAIELAQVEHKLNSIINRGATLGLEFQFDKIDVAQMGQRPPVWHFDFLFLKRIEM